jgi:phosphopentomutase
MAERSAGTDSTTGHWELAGLITSRAFPVYPNGFPADLLRRFCAATGCSGVLGNKPASGTEIINELGDEHVRTGSPIVYTSGDSVFQIAAHEAVIPPGRLYEICRMTRESVVVGEHAVGRVIARPFVGTSGAYTRTSGRKDFALEPGGTTVFDLLFRAGVETVGIGKIEDLFSGRGLARAIHTVSNADGITRTLEELRHLSSGFMMTNLVDFDMLFGHRQDPEGFAGALRQFDDALPALRTGLHDGDLLILTADHGNDPTDKSTDHTREFVPLLCVSPSGKRNIALGDRATFADLGKTIAEFFGVPAPGLAGESFLGSIR